MGGRASGVSEAPRVAVEGSECFVSGLGHRVQGFGFRVLGLGSWVLGLSLSLSLSLSEMQRAVLAILGAKQRSKDARKD